jgi:hypothetical protein
MDPHSQRGTATVESAALAALIAALVIAAVAAIAGGRALEGGRELASTLGRKIRCGAQGPGPCWRDPLALAYGRSVAGAVRALAPAPVAEGGLLPVDFRYCRSVGCAAPGSEVGLTASNRRVSAFVAVEESRGSKGGVTIIYWLYRPSLGWERIAVEADVAEVAALAGTPLLEESVPRLVPLETLSGRNHFDFAAGEEPRWRWRVESVYP